MLAFGVLHSYFRHVPAFSYLETFLLVYAFKLLVTPARKEADARS